MEIFKHPIIVNGALGIFAFVVIAEFFVLTIPLAWALSIPITDRITIELGEIPQWVIAFGVAVGIWRTWKAEQKAAITAAVTTAEIKAVSTQIDGLLVDRDKAKVKEGEAKGKQAGVDAAEQLAKGQREGRENERASVAAQGATTGGAAPTPTAATPDKQPLPVADDRTAGAAERVAEATERVARATEVKLTDGKK